MSYLISIVRVPEDNQPALPIALNEWIAAVKSVEGVRLASHRRGKGGDGGQSSPPRAGDAEVHVPDQDEWVRCFRFDNGTVLFQSTSGFDNPRDAVCNAARKLAAVLKARLRGAEGEFY